MSWSQLSQPQAALFAAALGATGAIIGGMIAAILTQLLGGRAQRRRQWDEIRHVAYARVAETFHSAWSLYDQTGRLRSDLGAQRRAADDLLAAYSRAVLLTRTERAAVALEELHERAQDLWDRPARPWSEIDDACRRAEWAFRREARAELGLSRTAGVRALPAAPQAAQAPAGPPMPAPAVPAGASAPAPAGESAKVSDAVTAKVASAGDEHK